MFSKMKMLIIKAWTKITTPEKKGYLKMVHIKRDVDNKIRKIIVYYPREGLPEYEVLS